MTVPDLTPRVEALESAVEEIRQYVEDDRRILASIDRLGVGVGDMTAVLNRLEHMAREIAMVKANSVPREEVDATARVLSDEVSETARDLSAQTDNARKHARRQVVVLAVVGTVAVALLSVMALGFRYTDVQANKVSCKAGNERVDHIVGLLHNLTADAPPEGQARIDRAVQPFIETKRDCDRLYQFPW
jgi:hypothetical protein